MPLSQYAEDFIHDLEGQKNSEQSDILSRFFKTGKGEYGEGDIFIGIKVPIQRKIAKAHFLKVEITNYASLLAHPVHEVRLSTLLLMLFLYRKTKDAALKESIAKIYLENLDRINNWDLVDLSAPDILGAHFFHLDHQPLYEMARTDHLWTQRIAILATYYFIKNKSYDSTIKIAEILLHHKHDLIHKAVGWMLREMGIREFDTEYEFLRKHYKQMPRTMLRYAIEKFPEAMRQDFLKGRID